MISQTELFKLKRAGYEEVAASGEIVVVDHRGLIFRTSDATGSYPVRSLLKPFQFLAAKIPLDRWEIVEGENRYLPCLGSVSATKEQVAQLDLWSKHPSREKLLSHLRVPEAFPMDEENRVELKSKNQSAKQIYHNCYSKHLAILEACEEYGWSKEGYFKKEHPYHQQLMAVLSGLLKNESVKEAPILVDGCGMPTPVLSLVQLAGLYQKLANSDKKNRLGKIRELILNNPEWLAAPKRLDTRLMRANPHKLVAKSGADGLWGISILPTQEFPQGLGIVLKQSGGYQPDIAALALAPVLNALGVKTVEEIPKGQDIHYSYTPFKRKTGSFIDISPKIGEETGVFPGDITFQRKISMDTEKGDHLTLSSMQTTLHIGAHTDAPNHFSKNAKGIDEIDLDYYSGPCQVIEIVKQPNSTIAAKDLDGIAITANRILFKTNSFPSTSHFNPDFVALSEGLIEYLSSKKVILVGIDTPSIDPSESKTLEAHHATKNAGIAILEGIILEKVEPGVYDLSALPLKISGGDASPVRAVLKR